MAVCLERGAVLHTAQLMPLPLTVSCFTKIQIGFAFLVPAHLGSPGKRAVKRLCVCVCVCDRVAANGDTANKVGTLQVAVVARHFGIAFYVAAPSSSVDLGISTGSEIVIEQRPASEMMSIAGVPITASGLFIIHSLVRRFLGLIQARRQKMKWRGCFSVSYTHLTLPTKRIV